LVPKNVNDDEQVRYIEVSAEMLEWRESEPDFLNKVMKVGFSYIPRGRVRNVTSHILQDGRRLTRTNTKSRQLSWVMP
jgi:hypothetical protein